MTNKEAIEQLKPLTELKQIGDFIDMPVISTEKQVEAIKLAIRLLEEYPQDIEIQNSMRRTYLGEDDGATLASGGWE